MMRHTAYPLLYVVIDRRGSYYPVKTLTEALQIQSLYSGAVIMQKDDAVSPPFVLVVSKAEEHNK